MRCNPLWDLLYYSKHKTLKGVYLMKKYVLAYSMDPGLALFTPGDLRALTHINLAFGLIKNGVLDMGGLPHIGLCERFREWNPDIKLVLSVGGRGLLRHGHDRGGPQGLRAVLS